MVLQNTRLVLRSQGSCDILAFLGSKDDSAEIIIHGMVIVKYTRVLCGYLDRLAEDGPGFAVQGMAVCCGFDIWTSLVDG